MELLIVKVLLKASLKPVLKRFLFCFLLLVAAFYAFLDISAPQIVVPFQLGALSIVFLLLIVGFVVSFVEAVWRRVEGIRVARQKILTREATFNEFSEIFSSLPADASILNVLEKAPLKPSDDETQAQLTNL